MKEKTETIYGTADCSVCHGSQVVVKARITRSAFWELAKFKHPTHQICFCTERALASLKFDAAEEVYDG